MAETRSAAAAAAGQAQLDAILAALYDLQTQQADSSAQIKAQLQLQQHRFLCAFFLICLESALLPGCTSRGGRLPVVRQNPT